MDSVHLVTMSLKTWQLLINQSNHIHTPTHLHSHSNIHARTFTHKQGRIWYVVIIEVQIIYNEHFTSMYVQKYKCQNFSQAKYTHCNHTTSRNNLHSQSTRPQDPFQSQAITSRCVWSSRQASTTAFLPRRRQASKQRVYSAEESMVTRYDLVALVS